MEGEMAMTIIFEFMLILLYRNTP